jgi:hypothetical protein
VARAARGEVSSEAKGCRGLRRPLYLRASTFAFACPIHVNHTLKPNNNNPKTPSVWITC